MRIWKTLDGREIPFNKLETDHLENIVAMIRRQGFVTPDEFFSMLAYVCSSDTPDGAAMAAESEVANKWPSEILADLEAELNARKYRL